MDCQQLGSPTLGDEDFADFESCGQLNEILISSWHMDLTAKT